MSFKKYFSEEGYGNIIRKLLDENKSIMHCELRMGSKSWCEFISEARKLAKSGELEFSKDDLMLLSTDLGKMAVLDSEDMNEAMYKDREVELDSPRRISGGDKKFMVYVDSGRKDKDGNIIAKRIEWGAPGMQIKNCDDKARKSFLARQQCSMKKDRTTAGWFACNIHLYHKQLGLQCDKPW